MKRDLGLDQDQQCKIKHKTIERLEGRADKGKLN